MTFRQKLTQLIFNKTVASSVISGVFGAVTTVVVTHVLQRDPAPQSQAATGGGTQQVQTPAPSFTPRADQDFELSLYVQLHYLAADSGSD